MSKTFIARASATINAPASRVWEAITNPELIKKYLFGTGVVSGWKVGSPILSRGEWQGKPFEDKGLALEIDPQKRLVSTHWSPCPVCLICRKTITKSPTRYQKRMGRRR